VRIDAASGDDLALASNDLGTRSDHDGDGRLDIGIASLADAADPAVPDADIGLDDPPVVDDQGVGDDRVGGC
ncbi:unnamed protein product, partial [Acidocella sp. C78]